MPTFYYKAKKENAETVLGQISAQDSEEAVELILAHGPAPLNGRNLPCGARGAFDPAQGGSRPEGTRKGLDTSGVPA